MENVFSGKCSLPFFVFLFSVSQTFYNSSEFAVGTLQLNRFFFAKEHLPLLEISVKHGVAMDEFASLFQALLSCL